jgi:hypothetical protein
MNYSLRPILVIILFFCESILVIILGVGARIKE